MFERKRKAEKKMMASWPHPPSVRLADMSKMPKMAFHRENSARPKFLSDSQSSGRATAKSQQCSGRRCMTLSNSACGC
jgi:hypothetical protein